MRHSRNKTCAIAGSIAFFRHQNKSSHIKPALFLQSFEAHAVECNAIALSWQAPANMGQPSLHKYKLERLKLGQEGKPLGMWELVSESLDDETHSYSDTGVQASLTLPLVKVNISAC